MFKKTLKFLLPLSLLGFAVGCSTVNPNEAAVKVYLTGDKAGVENAEVVTAGSIREGWGEKVYFINTSLQNYTYTSDAAEGNAADQSFSFTTNDGIKLTANISVRFRIADPKKFLVAYKIDDDGFVSGELRDALREAITIEGSKVRLADLFNYTNDPTKVGTANTEAFLQSITKSVNTVLNKNGVVIESIVFANGLTPPDKIQQQIEAAQEVQQQTLRIQQEATQAQAKLALETTNAQINNVKAASLTPAVLDAKRLELRQMELEIIKEKWNGQAPTTVVNGNGGNLPSVVLPSGN